MRSSQLLSLGAVVVSLLVAGLVGSSSSPAASGPCGTASVAPKYTHVLWIWMENHSFDKIIGSSSAPYINTLAGQCGLATNYHNISHPSLPNYIAATSGIKPLLLTKFDTDCKPSVTCSTSAPSIFGQLKWKAYEESMPSNCLATNSGYYYVRHNPPPYYSSLSTCSTDDVPYTQLSHDLSAGNLPAFSFVTPNAIDDMHNGTIAQGDSWLAKNVPAILKSSAYQSGSLVVFITWDEGSGGKTNDCATNTTDQGCHVATIAISPSTVAGTQSAALFNHYGLLATTELLLGVPPLGAASGATNMLSAFNL
jgi:phosphatidylinositol-3-phosphatase